MNLFAKLRERDAQGKPLRVGLIGAGKFGTMYLAQVPKTPGVHLSGIADLSPAAAKANLQRVGWKPERYAAATLDVGRLKWLMPWRRARAVIEVIADERRSVVNSSSSPVPEVRAIADVATSVTKGDL